MLRKADEIVAEAALLEAEVLKAVENHIEL